MDAFRGRKAMKEWLLEASATLLAVFQIYLQYFEFTCSILDLLAANGALLAVNTIYLRKTGFYLHYLNILLALAYKHDFYMSLGFPNHTVPTLLKL